MFQAFCIALALRAASGQPMGFGGPAEYKAPAVKADLPYIKCQSCEVLIRESHRGVRKIREEARLGHKMTEDDVFEYLEKICDPDTDEGEWIAMIDLVEQESKLRLVDMDTVGFCESECRTIARACSDVLEDVDYELAGALFKGEMGRAPLTQRFCRELSSVCDAQPPDLPRSRPTGPPFIPMTEDDYKMAKMMQQMKQMGLGGQVFDQDSAQRFVAEHSGEMDEDDDDAAEERPPNRDRAAESEGLSLRQTLDWVKRETGKKLDAGYAALQDAYDRVQDRWKRDETEL